MNPYGMPSEEESSEEALVDRGGYGNSSSGDSSNSSSEGYGNSSSRQTGYLNNSSSEETGYLNVDELMEGVKYEPEYNLITDILTGRQYIYDPEKGQLSLYRDGHAVDSESYLEGLIQALVNEDSLTTWEIVDESSMVEEATAEVLASASESLPEDELLMLDMSEEFASHANNLRLARRAAAFCNAVIAASQENPSSTGNVTILSNICWGLTREDLNAVSPEQLIRDRGAREAYLREFLTSTFEAGKKHGEERQRRVAEFLRARVTRLAPPPTKQEGHALPSVPLHRTYAGEDTQEGRFRIPLPGIPHGTGAVTTKYEPAETMRERSATPTTQGRVVGSDGKLMTGRWGYVVDGNSGSLLFFKANKVTVIVPPGVWDNFTLPRQAEDGSLANAPDGSMTFDCPLDKDLLASLITQGCKIQYQHHSTPIAGAPAGLAGMMEFQDGRITLVSDESGHYMPPAQLMDSGLRYLIEEWGASLEHADIHLTGVPPEGEQARRPTSKNRDIDVQRHGGRDAHGDMKVGNPYFPTGDIRLSYEQFELSGGNESGIRNKMALAAEMEDNARVQELHRQAERTAVSDSPGETPVTTQAASPPPAPQAASTQSDEAQETTTYTPPEEF